MDATVARTGDSLWRALFERAGDPMLVLDGGRHVVAANDAAVALLAVSPEHLAGSALADLLPAREAARLDECWAHLVEGGELVATTEVVPAHGHRRVVQIHARAHIVPGRHLAILRDVTESESRAGAVARSEARYRESFEQAPTAAAVVDLDARVLAVNQAMVALSGRDAEALLAGSLHDLVHPDDPLVLGPGATTWRLCRADGTTVCVRAAVALATDAQGAPSHYVVQFEDLEPQQQAEHEHLEAVRIDTMARLAGGFAPEFNNALMAIGGHAELAEAKLHDQPDVADSVRSIRRSQERAAALTRRLLELGRCQVSRPEVVPLEERLAPLLPRLTAVAGARVGVRLRLDLPGADVVVDPVQLEWVVEELVVNARDAMPDGGRVTIATSDHGPDGVAGRNGRPLRWLTVSDTGDGMDEHTLANALLPFFTTKARGDALGIGLAAVHGIVHASGGVLTVASEPGVGTTVSVGLPVPAEPGSWPPPQT